MYRKGEYGVAHQPLEPCTLFEGIHLSILSKHFSFIAKCIFSTNYDYDRWALYGGSQWNARNMLPLFKELEANSLTNVADTEQFLQYPFRSTNRSKKYFQAYTYLL